MREWIYFAELLHVNLSTNNVKTNYEIDGYYCLCVKTVVPPEHRMAMKTGLWVISGKLRLPYTYMIRG